MKLDFLKLEDKVHLENVLSVSKYVNNLLPPVFDKWFTFVLILTITKQSLHLLVNCSNPLSELTTMGITVSASKY